MTVIAIIIITILIICIIIIISITPSPPTKSFDFGGFDSSIILISMGEILMSTGNFLESLSQAILVGIM